MGKLFKQTAYLIADIDNFLDNISKAGLLFGLALREYLEGEEKKFHARIDEIAELESDSDVLRREIRHKLYSKMLIPESRGDVLNVLENIDNVIDTTKKVVFQIDIERPSISEDLKKDFQELVMTSQNALDFTVKAARAFFRDSEIINDYVHKVYFYEHEADKIEELIKRKVFSSEELPTLAERMHIRDFATYVASLSDESQAVCERISVAAVKRSL
ncbi:MAG: DUF47 family protein [Spirochaetia bacterium]|nr:DUF47 family protein [Spirochaetia bacterium]